MSNNGKETSRNHIPRSYYFTTYKDGTDKTLDIMTPQGEVLASIPFWDDEETAEMKASLIVNALNAYRPQLLDRVKDIVTTHDTVLKMNEKPSEKPFANISKP